LQSRKTLNEIKSYIASTLFTTLHEAVLNMYQNAYPAYRTLLKLNLKNKTVRPDAVKTNWPLFSSLSMIASSY